MSEEIEDILDVLREIRDALREIAIQFYVHNEGNGKDAHEERREQRWKELFSIDQSIEIEKKETE